MSNKRKHQHVKSAELDSEIETIISSPSTPPAVVKVLRQVQALLALTKLRKIEEDKVYMLSMPPVFALDVDYSFCSLKALRHLR